MMKKAENSSSSSRDEESSVSEHSSPRKEMMTKVTQARDHVSKGIGKMASSATKNTGKVAKQIMISNRTNTVSSHGSTTGTTGSNRAHTTPVPVEKENHVESAAPEKILPTSSIKESSPYTTNSLEEALLDDHTIVWVMVASIVLLQTVGQWAEMSFQSVPLSVMFAWMLAAFTIGLEVDGEALVEELKSRLLGLGRKQETTTTRGDRQSFVLPQPLDDSPLDDSDEMVAPTTTTSRSLWRIFPRIRKRVGGHRQDVDLSPLATVPNRNIPPRTSLSIPRLTRQKPSMVSKNLLNSLARFRPKIKKGSKRVDTQTSQDEGPERSETDVDSSFDDMVATKQGSSSMGSLDSDKTAADVLIDKVDLGPQFQLRGIDVFLTEASEPEMGTHPYLLQNGLRDVPTFMFNVMTHWGQFLFYFEMPDWVKDTTTGLVEEDGDPKEVKAIKRFVNGDDDYRRARLKIMPELVEAPYAARIMAPKGKELVVEINNLVHTTYQHYEAAGTSSPVVEVAVDLAGNSTVRGMSSIVKRYLAKTSIDFALIISKPEGQVEDEPEACLGLWRMDHVNLSEYPQLPDRYATEGKNEEDVNAIRSSMLVKRASMILVTSS